MRHLLAAAAFTALGCLPAAAVSLMPSEPCLASVALGAAPFVRSWSGERKETFERNLVFEAVAEHSRFCSEADREALHNRTLYTENYFAEKESQKFLFPPPPLDLK